MVTLNQIRQLDEKVQKAVDFITLLKKENSALTEKLGEYQKRIDELEIMISEFKDSQGEIEQGILHAIDQLNSVEGDLSADKISEQEPPLDNTSKDITKGTTALENHKMEPEAEARSKESEEPESEEPDANKEQTAELDIF